MTKRLTTLLAGGTLALAVTFLGSRYLVAWSRPQTNEEWQAERNAKSRAEWKAELRRETKEAIAHTPPGKMRTLYEYDLRLLDHSDRSDDILSLIDLRDGINEFEALVIARRYFSWEFGLCGDVDLPEKKDGQWVAAISVGRGGHTEPPIFVDAQTGVVHCAGHPTVTDVLALIEDPGPPAEMQRTPTQKL